MQQYGVYSEWGPCSDQSKRSVPCLLNDTVRMLINALSRICFPPIGFVRPRCSRVTRTLTTISLFCQRYNSVSIDNNILIVSILQKARLAHTIGVQRESLRQMKLGQLTSRVAIWVREWAIRMIPPSMLQKKLRAANVFDIEPWLERFRVLKAKQSTKADGGS